MIFPQKFKFYFVFCIVIVLSAFGLLSVYYDVVLFVILLWRFICVKVIRIGKTDLIRQRYQILVVSLLKNWSRRYSSHYITKFEGFMSIYHAINLDIVSLYMVFSYLYLRFIASLN